MKAAAIIFAVIAGFSTVVTGFTVNCLFGTESFTSIGSVYRCWVPNIAESTSHTVTNVTGTHSAGKTNEDVKAVYIIGNGLSFVPRGLTSFFPNLIGYYMHYTTFDALNGDELDQFGEKLVWFGVQNSNLTTISSRLFDSTPNIAHVFFGSNKIQRVGRDLFTAVNVAQLGYIYFYDNPCISKYANNQTDIVALINELQVSCP
jgi:hypothetical protein